MRLTTCSSGTVLPASWRVAKLCSGAARPWNRSGAKRRRSTFSATGTGTTLALQRPPMKTTRAPKISSNCEYRLAEWP